MKIKWKLIIFTFIYIFSIPSQVFAIDYAWASPMYIDEKCSVLIWIYGKGKPQRIEYKGELILDRGELVENRHCNVPIRRKDFEKYFKYCVISGIDVEKEGIEFFAKFAGGPAGDRDIYWFEWGPARYVRPTFYCILRKEI